MNIPLQAAQITGLAQLSPAPRNLFFFNPVLNQHGRLVDLKRYSPEPSAHADHGISTCLSNWITPSTGPVLDSLWTLLEKGTVCCLAYKSVSGKPGQLLITPMEGGYLVEIQVDLALVTTGLSVTPAELPQPALPSEQVLPLDTVNELLDTIVANTPVGLALLRPVQEAGHIVDFSYLWANPAHATISGNSPAQLTGQRLKTVRPAAAAAGLFERLVDVVQTGTALHYRKYVQYDGIDLWGEFMISRVGENVLFTVMDISHLMQTKALLHEKNTQLEYRIAERTQQVRQLSTLQNAILKHAGQAIISTNNAGVVQTVNQAVETLLGFGASELIGKVARLKDDGSPNAYPVVRFCPYDPDESYNFFARPAVVENGYVQQECLLLTNDGRLAPVLLTVSRLEDEDGSTIGYMGIATDISALKLAEARLRQKNQILDTFFAGALDMHCIADRKGFLLEVNHAFQNAMGYSADEIRTIPLLQLIHPDERSFVSKEVLKKIQRQSISNQVNQWRRKDGTYRIIEWSAIGVDGLVYGSARDITDRQAAQDQLRQLTDRLQLATQAAGQGIWENDLVNDKVIWDERLWELYGLPLPIRPLTYADYVRMMHPEDRATLRQKGKNELDKDQNHISNTFRIIRPDGVVRYLETSGRIIRDSAGTPRRLIGVAWDVTRRKRAEETLRASEQRYRSLVDHLDTIVFHTNSEGRWTYLNPAWEVVTGFSVEESLGGFFLDSILPEDHTETRALFEEIKASERTSVRHIIRYKHKGGGFRWIDVNAHVLSDAAHLGFGVTGTLTDITERRIAEEAIQESEQRFREIAENVDEIFAIMDSEKPVFLYVNPAFERFTGIPAQSLYENPLLFLAHILEEDRNAVQSIFQSVVSGSEFTFRARHQDGSLRWLNTRVFGVTSEAGVLLRRVGVVTDITATIEKEQILEASLQNERTLNSLKSQFISTASHEFRTPLMAISSSTELVRHYLEVDDVQSVKPLMHKHLTTVLTKVASLSELIGDTLTLSKIEQGKLEVQPEWTDLVALCKALVASTFAERKDKRHIHIQTTGQAVLVLLDIKLMNHILTNLLTNAIKFSTKNVTLTLAFTQEAVSIAVSDQGIGIPRKDLPHLFDKFFRAGNAVNYQGSGLGLAICQEYTSLMKGEISVVSKEGTGTTFTVTIPYA